ncbi:MAG: RNA methyltransferase [Hahellaceae bacterium]|nr:RNA methyltransferase [Hahellaceae bacterium]
MYKNVRIVMMNTSHPGNIGAVARAMKNMCFSGLWLVSPNDFPSDVAVRRASGATDVLDAANVVSSFDEAVAGCVAVFGTSARGRRIPWPIMNPRDAVAKVNALVEASHGEGEVAIVFGQEDRGLSNEELQRCNYHIHIPSNLDYSSLNVAMAVQIMLYELRMHELLTAESAQSCVQSGVICSPSDPGWDEPMATVDEVEGCIQHFERTMIATGFHDPANPRQLITRVRRMFQRIQLDRMEINIMRGFFKEVLKLTQKQD